MDVLLLFGSESDMPVADEAVAMLEKLGISYQMNIASAHRTPGKVRSLVEQAEADGCRVIIAGAGLSAHLAGVVAGETLLPVIGIPIDGGALRGLDSLLSTVNMPPGVPVATVSLGKAGGRNSALLAARIIALGDADVAEKLKVFRQEMADKVESADKRAGRKG